ncbi:MAG TPA: hypothetical protein PL045_01665 [Chitinophagaceae bacterium]|nr:hypothetical protein [Chitinophagaceae bacterium]
MKHLFKTGMLAVLFAAGLFATPAKTKAQQVSVSFQLFYDQLSPYGQWVDYPEYGYAWIPSVSAGFSPYSTDGHWVLTDQGWTWVSDYAWGWAAFHYGRWLYNPMYGWVWIPDTQWGPAWVSWRRSAGYYGWAPLGPGISISVALGGGYSIPAERWVFVKEGYINRPDVRRYYVPRSQNVTIIKNTTVIKNTYVDKSRNVTYVAGPDKVDVEKHTGRVIKPVVIQESAKPAQSVSKDKMVVYRPQIKQADDNGKKPVPQKVVALKDYKNNNAQKTESKPAANSNTNKPKQKPKSKPPVK